MRASSSVVIDRQVEDVFAYAATIENMDAWVHGVGEPRRTSEGPFGVGSTFASTYTYGSKTHDITYVVTRHEPPGCYGVKSTSGPFPFEGVIELRPIGGGTEITNTIDAGADSKGTEVIFALFGPILRVMMRKQLRRELESLKATLEAPALSA